MKISLEERNKIILEFLPKITYIVKSIKYDNLPPTLTEEDLVNIGVLGLIDAIEKYDPSKNVKLSTYAEIRIRGHILDALRKLDWIPRNVRQKAKEIERAILKVEQELGREASAKEIADYIGISEEEYIKYAEKISNSILVSIDMSLNSDNENGTKLWQILSVSEDTPDKYVEEEELKEILSDIIFKLSEKERLVITLYYYEELPMKKIAEILGLTESRISQIHTKTMIKIRKMLENYIR